MQEVEASYHVYFPSFDEWSIALGSLSASLLIITLFARIYPIIPIQETIHEQHEQEEQQ
jgi:molybdopterin-containing oxidoreductase family membrane subunit